MSTGVPENPTHKLGDVVNGHRLIAQDDGTLEWTPLPTDPTTGAPVYADGDVVNGHRLTSTTTGAHEWVPVAATVPASSGPSYQVGDVVNGHRLSADEAGMLSWVPESGAVTMGSSAAPRSQSRHGVIIALSVVGGLIVFAILVGAIGSLGRPSTSNRPEANNTTEDQRDETPMAEMVLVPAGLVGMTAQQASDALAAVGLRASYDGDADALVLSVSPTSDEVEAGSTIRLTVEQPPALTLAQQNAIREAESYLDYTPFSRSGLIGQLEYEGYTAEESTFAVDYVNPDWNEQAAKHAASYLEYSSFSRSGLYDQLIYEGYTPEQANYGLAAVGY